jgi:hypothetical protein
MTAPVSSVTTPNTTTASQDGTPHPLPVVVDDTSFDGSGPFIQQFAPSGWMRWVLGMLAPFGTAFDPVTGRLRMLLDPVGGGQTLGTVTTVTTVTTLSNITSIGGFAAQAVVFDIAAQVWSQQVRSRIT